MFHQLITLMMEVARTSETSVNNYFTRQYIPEDKSEHDTDQLSCHKKYSDYKPHPSCRGCKCQRNVQLIFT
jgi:hypothetical protein